MHDTSLINLLIFYINKNWSIISLPKEVGLNQNHSCIKFFCVFANSDETKPVELRSDESHETWNCIRSRTSEVLLIKRGSLRWSASPINLFITSTMCICLSLLSFFFILKRVRGKPESFLLCLLIRRAKNGNPCSCALLRRSGRAFQRQAVQEEEVTASLETVLPWGRGAAVGEYDYYTGSGEESYCALILIDIHIKELRNLVFDEVVGGEIWRGAWYRWYEP